VDAARVCFANIPTIRDSRKQTFPQQTKMKTLSVRMTRVPNSIGDAQPSHPRQRLALDRFERNESTFTAPAVRRLQAIQSPAGARPALLRMPVRS
jgi:hypothetical protein